ncbi:hypothetical protein CC2G_012133 [Coprinopsis cinerea AmutBmut pab1-1]|nr:hypothetical protein CC2G_012133 [Coprinopsis cinerea AmutBmut pab1-1]
MSRDNQQEAVSRGWRVSLSNSLSNHSSISLSPPLSQPGTAGNHASLFRKFSLRPCGLETSSKSKPVHDDYWSEVEDTGSCPLNHL